MILGILILVYTISAVDGEGFMAQDICIENTAGPTKELWLSESVPIRR